MSNLPAGRPTDTERMSITGTLHLGIWGAPGDGHQAPMTAVKVRPARETYVAVVIALDRATE